MTLSELRNDLGSVINQTDTSGDFASTIITTTEANNFINEAALRVYREYALKYPTGLTTTAVGDLTDEQAVYPFGGDASSCMAILSVFVQIDSADEKLTRAYPLQEEEYYETGWEQIPASAPRYIKREILVDGVYASAIEFPEDCVPDHTTTSNSGLKIIYLKRPSAMTEATDYPQRLPSEYHYMISYGASVKAFFKLGQKDDALTMRSLFEQEIINMKHTDRQEHGDQPFRLKVSRSDTLRFHHNRR